MILHLHDLVSWKTKWHLFYSIETVSPEGRFCDTVQVPSGADDMETNLDID